MLGQSYSIDNKKYNVIILAGGAGTRMNVQSDYIPKALTVLGEQRAIDYIIEKYIMVAKKFIIGVSYHSDLLISYIKGKYSNLFIDFSYEPPNELCNNGISTLYCLDYCDSKCGTIITFCDLLVVSNNNIVGDSLLLADKKTRGNIGTFRHTVVNKDIIIESQPVHITDSKKGVLGRFVFRDSYRLKSIAYNKNTSLTDLTTDIVIPYFKDKPCYLENCNSIYEFGNEEDLQIVRELWESHEHN